MDGAKTYYRDHGAPKGDLVGRGYGLHFVNLLIGLVNLAALYVLISDY